MRPTLKEIEEREKRRKEERQKKARRKFNNILECPKCGSDMIYVFGETYQCTFCKYETLTDFGRVKEYLAINGPQCATKISNDTGVELDTIQGFLSEGRIEIPEGSDIFIKCKGCGTDIRFGMYCSECAAKNVRGDNKAILSNSLYNKPKDKGTKNGKMHTVAKRIY